MSLKLFITGTDTMIGKTYITVGLLNLFKQKKLQTFGIKPISSGCVLKNNEWVNDDVMRIRQHSSIQLSYQQMNPFAFKPHIAPHIAAQNEGKDITVTKLIHKTKDVLQTPADVCVIEGVGGWYCPLNHKQTMADYVKTMQFSTILVIGVRLGCLNQALLACKAILLDQVPLIGWIANCIDPHMENREENIATLNAMLPVPCLGVVDYLGRPEESIHIENGILSCVLPA